jgi:hypothetical protein
LLPGNYKLAALSIYINNLPKHDSLAVAYYETGVRFDDPSTQTLSLPANGALKLKDLILPKAKGAIAGTVYLGTPPQRLTTNGYLIFAFDALGYLTKVSIYDAFYRPIDGQYLLTGLRPGTYYLLAAIVDESGDDFIFQWLGGTAGNFTFATLVPKVSIPATAAAVTVGENLESGKDFFFKFTTGVQEPNETSIVREFRLHQNYPNPFNPGTTIAYELPEPAHVVIQVFNLLGAPVATLVNQRQPAGAHQIQWQAANVPSGLYFFRIEAGKFKQVKKGLLLK